MRRLIGLLVTIPLAGKPAGYLKDLPAPIAADACNGACVITGRMNWQAYGHATEGVIYGRQPVQTMAGFMILKSSKQ